MPYQRQPRDQQPPDERSGRYLLTDDTADALAAGGTLQITDAWTTWDWVRWGMPYFISGNIAGLVLILVIR
jgi:hypothetical protein